jgi:hypothetical protein
VLPPDVVTGTTLKLPPDVVTAQEFSKTVISSVWDTSGVVIAAGLVPGSAGRFTGRFSPYSTERKAIDLQKKHLKVLPQWLRVAISAAAARDMKSSAISAAAARVAKLKGQDTSTRKRTEEGEAVITEILSSTALRGHALKYLATGMRSSIRALLMEHTTPPNGSNNEWKHNFSGTAAACETVRHYIWCGNTDDSVLPALSIMHGTGPNAKGDGLQFKLVPRPLRGVLKWTIPRLLESATYAGAHDPLLVQRILRLITYGCVMHHAARPDVEMVGEADDGLIDDMYQYLGGGADRLEPEPDRKPGPSVGASLD